MHSAVVNEGFPWGPQFGPHDDDGRKSLGQLRMVVVVLTKELNWSKWRYVRFRVR